MASVLDDPPASAPPSRLWIARNNLIDLDIIVDDRRRELERARVALADVVHDRNRAALHLARLARARAALADAVGARNQAAVHLARLALGEDDAS